MVVTGELNMVQEDYINFKENKAVIKVASIQALPSFIPINNICLAGRAGRDSELRYFESGKVVASVSLAVRRNKEEADWFNLEAWNKTAEICGNYVTKGGLIGVQGSLRFDTWSDRTTGKPRTKPIIQVERLELLGSKPVTETVAA